MDEWFKRPLKIGTYDWSENTYFSETLNPWKLYFSNPEIYSKLKGYTRLQATLNVKLTINASPYQYSMGVMSYLPLDSSTSDRFSGGVVSDYMFDQSQSGSSIVTSRPHVFFYPQFSRGCEMTLPFVYYKNWINLDTNLYELDALGRLDLRSLVPLLTTSEPAVLPITVTVFAWCSDFKVSAPSYSLQAGDEYTERPVSTTASALSKAAGALASIAPLRPYALATSMVLSKMGEVARWFGFSNPPVIADIHATRINLMPQYSSPEVSVQFDKFALDPKNEVTIDPRTVGLDGTDQMTIEYVINRDVGLNIVEWRATDLPTTPLYVAHVTPMYSFSRTLVGAITAKPQVEVQMLPSAHVGAVFDFWRGPITYRFTAIASQFHRGRLLVSYDPDGWKNSYTAAAFTGPRTISKIWDIQENSDFEFEVPYMAPTAMLRTGGLIGQFTDRKTNTFVRPTLPSTFSYSDPLYNGSIIVSVLNGLTSNDPAANINLFVRVNAGKVEFSNPRDMELPTSNYTLQSGDATSLTAEPDTTQQATVDTIQTTDHSVYVGEVVRSLRTLMHRTNRLGVIPCNTFDQDPNSNYSTELPYVDASSALYGNAFQFEHVFPMLPLPPGHLPHGVSGFYQGVQAASGGGSMQPNQLLRPPTVTAWFSAAYVGWRGSHRYHAKLPYLEKDVLIPGNTSANDQIWHIRVRDFVMKRHMTSMRNKWVKATVSMFQVVRLQLLSGFITITDQVVRGYNLVNGLRRVTETSAQGAASLGVTAHTVQPVLDGVFPYYSNFRMMPCNPIANFEATYDNTSLSWNHFDQTSDRTWQSRCAISTTVDSNFREGSVAISTLSFNASAYPDHFPAVELYHAAGPDFSCFMYLNVPTYYCYTQATDGYVSAYSM